MAQTLLDLLSGDFSSLSLTGSGTLLPQSIEFFSYSTTIPVFTGLNIVLGVSACSQPRTVPTAAPPTATSAPV